MNDHVRISAFLDAQAAELGAAKNTRLAYGRDLKDFAGWLAARKLGFEGATQDDVEDYLVACEAEGLSRATRARRLSAIRQLFRFAFEEGWRTDNPAIQIRGSGQGPAAAEDADGAGGGPPHRGGADGRPDEGPGAEHVPSGTALCDGDAGERARGASASPRRGGTRRCCL